MFEPLVLDPVPESLWLAFHHGRGAALRAPARQPVLRQWQRMRALGAPIDGPAADDAMAGGAMLRERIERVEPLLACGRPVLDRIAAVAREHDYRLIVADPQGMVVSAAGGGAFADDAERLRLQAGADWSESRRGTNAIGTALAEGRPVFVHGAAHYARNYHGLVCYAAPVRGPDGELVAVLDATSVHERAAPAMALAVLAGAQALEEVLRLRAWSQAGDSVLRTIGRSIDRMHCAAVVLEPPGRIARLNTAARELFFGALAHHTEVHQLLGLHYGELAALAVGGAVGGAIEVRSPHSGQRLCMRLDPIESAGRVIAVLAAFEPVAAPRRAGGAVALSGGPTAAAHRPFAELFHEDAAVHAALQVAARVAQSELPVMLLAETGSGKELVARGVHAASARQRGPFVAVNCGSIAASLFESELFGYGPGAFTGAERRGRDGYLQAATGGTLFLDEVGEMPPPMQAALLRFLESGMYRRVGETAERHADVRIVCATCRDLPTMVAAGTFRTDLYFRLKGAVLRLPPLRQRSDLLPLAHHLLQQLAAADHRPAPHIADDVAAVLSRYDWPGNVRELKSTLQIALVLAGDEPTIRRCHLPAEFGTDLAAAAPPPHVPPADTRAAAEREALHRALREARGNLSDASRRLGVARSTLYRMMRRHGSGDCDATG